jgi:uncharacterized protein (DUF2235 family)
MIHKVGIILKSNQQQLPVAFDMYKNKTWTEANKFRHQASSVETDIEFIGVWWVPPHFQSSCIFIIFISTFNINRDTVDSVGISGHCFPFVASNKIVKTFRHAVALDEHRVKFNAHLWQKEADKKKDDPTLEHSIERARMQETDVLEVWFAGVHCGE